MKRETTAVVLALGSNNEQRKNISACKRMLEQYFPGIVFTRQLWTDPIGMVSPKFLNCLACFSTTHTLYQLQVAIRNIEGRCGNRKALRTRSIISIDVDILLYGDKKLHEADWERPYVKELMESLPKGLLWGLPPSPSPREGGLNSLGSNV